MLECVANVSEGCDENRLATLDRACGHDLLDRHSDCDHHRSVFTTVDESAVRHLATSCLELLDLGEHRGVHPRLGVLDVVPFVPLAGTSMAEARRARDDFAQWTAHELRVPVFLYGPADTDDRQLPDLRREAWTRLLPDFGPSTPHPTAGAICVGVRDVLVAFNIWLDGSDFDAARAIARDVRGDGIRALALRVGRRLQVSTNLIDPRRVGPLDAYERVSHLARKHGVDVDGCELVGLLPADVLERVPETHWSRLDLAESKTIESRLAVR